MEITRYKNDEIREKHKTAMSITRKEAEWVNDRINARLEALPSNSPRHVAIACDRITEAGMYAFSPDYVDCPGCQNEMEFDKDSTPEDGECPTCRYDLTDELKELHQKSDKSPETADLPRIEEFVFVGPGDEEVLQILTEIENLKIRCPEEWDIWDHLSDAQVALMSVR